VLGLGGCAGTAADSDAAAAVCGGTPCVVPDSEDALLDALDGLDDPMAAVLRANTSPDATFAGGFEALLDALGDEVGCDADTARSFVVLSNDELRPKTMVNLCVDDPVQASRFFMGFEPSASEDDVDPQTFRVAAWDDTAARYRRYQFVAAGADLAVSVEPEFCAGCHGGVTRREPWAPIMNEMTEPWAQWNAEPGFASFRFDGFAEHAGGETLEAVAAVAARDSASNFEPVIRAAVSRVSTAGVDTRDQSADLDAALDLLRPVFCDETVNFVSEIHDSGDLNLQAVLDPGLVAAYNGIEGGGSFSWQTDLNLRVEAPTPGAPQLALLAVRGHTVVAAEAALRSRGVLTPMQILRVRALDWTHPFASDLRCDLFNAAQTRAQAGEGVANPATYPDNASLVAALYDDAMQVAGVPLVAATPGALVALADADDTQALAQLQAGQLAPLEADLVTLGEDIAAHLDGLSTSSGRTQLLAERDRRGCIAAATYPTIAPLLTDLPACA